MEYDPKTQDLRVNRPWERLPPHLVLPMILMRENMKKSMLQSLNNSPADLTLTPIPPKKWAPTPEEGFSCPDCDRVYKLKSSLRNHQKWECGKEPQFKCPYCSYKAKQKMHMARHMERMHRDIEYNAGVKNEIKTEQTAADTE